MELKLAAMAILIGCALSTRAQDASFDGRWAIKVDGKRAVDLGGALIIKGNVGTWSVIAKASGNPCVGRDYPLSVKTTSTEQIVLEVDRATVLQGCKNSTYTFKRVDATTLEGEFGGGRTVTLKRE